MTIPRRKDENGLGDLHGEGRISVAPETEPAPQSGMDIASNPKLLRRKATRRAD
jgi:hypothetical protein